MQLVKHLKGHSGATVSLYKDNDTYKVIKDNYDKAEQSVDILKRLPFNTPDVYEVTSNKIVMEYINGMDIATYLTRADNSDVDKLIDFLSEYINWCLDNSTNVDFFEPLSQKIYSLVQYIDLSSLLTEKWSDIPQSLIHGDFTLENILYSNNKFYFIDANPTNLNSIWFDANKLRQDIDSLWFVRNKKPSLELKLNCSRISKELKKRFTFMQKDYIMVLMLSRILPYTIDKKTDEFLRKDIKKIWQ